MSRRRLLDDSYKKTVEGNPAIATDSLARMRPGLSICGKSEQRTTTGAQLINTQDSGNSRGINWVFDRGIATFSGVTMDAQQARVLAKTSVKDVMEIGKTYFAKSFTTGVESDIRAIKPSGNVCDTKYTPDGTETSIIVTALVNNSLDAGVEIELTAYIALTENESLSAWEPYTGGQPSPSPEYPQEIVVAGSGGSIKVDVGGANLLPNQECSEYYLNQSGTLFGKAPGNYTKYLQVKPGNTYYVKKRSSTGKFRLWTYDSIPISGTYNPINAVIKDSNSEANITVNANYLFIQCETESDFDELMVSLYNYAPYEPYKTPQSLTVSTPNGLPGIPVSSGGNYTDENGQQWVCDEIDFDRGKYVQRVQKITVDGAAAPFGYAPVGNDYAACRVHHIEGIIPYAGICENLKFARSYNSGEYSNFNFISGLNNSTDLGFVLPFALLGVTIENTDTEIQNAMKKFLQSNPITVYCSMVTPIETDLSEEQINAYSSIHTNRPTTVISTSDDVGLKLTYKSKKSLEVT